MKRCIILLTAAAMSVSALAAPDFAPDGEESLQTILNTLYGQGNWQRVEQDQVWQNINGSASAIAKYAAYTHEFGYFEGTSGGTFQSLFTVAGSGFAVEGQASLSDLDSGDLLRWGLNVNNADLWSSVFEENSDGQRHMMTFRITGGNSQGDYVLAWEDMHQSGWGSSIEPDYNDLVIQVSGVVPVPAPGAILMAGIGTTLVGWLRRRRSL